MWSFSYTKCKRIVFRTKIYFTQHQHIVKRVHHLKKNQQNNRQNNKILTNRAKAHTHTQPNNLHIERAQANLTNTHILATHRKFMNLHIHTLIAKQWISTLNYTQPHTMNKRISIFVASAFEAKKTLNQTKSYPKTSFCINNTHTQPSMNIIPNSSGERVVVQTEKRDKYQTRIVFLYNPHYPPYYYHYYNYYWICNVTLPTHQYNKQKKHKSKQWKNKKHSTQINPTFSERLL